MAINYGGSNMWLNKLGYKVSGYVFSCIILFMLQECSLQTNIFGCWTIEDTKEPNLNSQ